MLKKILTILLTCYIGILSAQQVEVSGQVKDDQSKEALEFCSVAVFNAKDSLINSTVTDDKGFFTVLLLPGQYRAIINYAGYKADTLKSVHISGKKFLGVIRLVPDVKNLQEVSIKASSRENLIDRDEQIVTDKLRAGASDTKDVLSKLNGVEYDRYTDAIKVDNSDKVIILVDGLEKDQEYIKNLSPDRLKKIEIIRSPGGRYGLEGYTAVINIILKKDYKGTEIFLKNRMMADPDAFKKQYILVQNNADLSINYAYNKLNVYATGSGDYNNFNLQSTVKKEYTNGLVIEQTIPDPHDMNTKVKQLFNSYTLGADYFVNPKQTISFESNVKTQPPAYNVTNGINNLLYSNNGTTLLNSSSEVKNISSNYSTYNSLFYVGKLGGNNNINSNFTYSSYSGKYNNSYSEGQLFTTNENGTNNKNSSNFHVEYQHTFKNNSSLETGYGNTWEKQHNDYTTDSVSSRFLYTDIRHQLYTYYASQHKKWGIKFGGAAEVSLRNADGQSNSYLIVEPYADIQYKPSQLIDFKLKYRSESTYPNISQTNPFTTAIDQQSVSTGNPYLRPQVLNKISLQTDLLGGLVTVEPYYHFSNNYITETGTLRPDSIFEYNYSNVGYYSNYGVQTNFTVPFGKSLFLQSDVDIFESSIKYADKTNNLDNWAMSSQLIYQNKKSHGMVGLKYQKYLQKYITAQGYDAGGNDYWIMFMQQPLLNNKLNVMLLYFLPVDFGVNFDQGSYIKTAAYTETKSNDISFLKNMLMLKISYRFDKGKRIHKVEKNVEHDNEENTKSIF